VDSELGLGEAKVFELDLNSLARAQAIEEHQGNKAEVTISTKAGPEAGDLIGRKRDDYPAWLL
jgi:hypothetical protein